MNKAVNNNRSFLIPVFLVLGTLATYWPVLQYDFVKYDDDKYVTENPHVNGGITYTSVFWAFTRSHEANWHPLTWLSHMLDCQLFGLNPLGHHLTNLLIHVANTLLLFAILKRMTGQIWPSGFVAAAFALHPLHVESVAWVAERKDVLSGLFWMLTIAAYTRYAQRPSTGRFLLVCFAFGLGLMAKPMLVTLPFVLLLLDYWPLGRLRIDKLSFVRTRANDNNHRPDAKKVAVRLIVEKTPLFLLTGVSCAVTFFVQRAAGAVFPMRLLARMAVGTISYGSYIGKMVWPAKLAVFYPLPETVEIRLFALCIILLTAITIAAAYWWRRHPWFLIGWLWYLGTLVPVSGLIKVGSAAMADRYTYVPSIGIFVLVAWGARELVSKWRLGKIVPAVAACMVLATWLICTRLQLRHWKDSAALFKHALDVTTDNFVMESNYANFLSETGRTEQATEHYQKALKLRPKSAQAYTNLGNALMNLDKTDDAIGHYKKAVSLAPDLAVAHHNLARALAENRANAEAIREYREAVRLKPDYFEAWGNLGLELAQDGAHEEAVECFNKAIAIEPDNIIAHGQLGLALAALLRDDEAIEQFRIVLKARPDDYEMHFNLGFLLERRGKSDEAIEEYRRALQINPDFSKARRQLEAVLAKQKNP